MSLLQTINKIPYRVETYVHPLPSPFLQNPACSPGHSDNPPPLVRPLPIRLFHQCSDNSPCQVHRYKSPDHYLLQWPLNNNAYELKPKWRYSSKRVKVMLKEREEGNRGNGMSGGGEEGKWQGYNAS